MSSDSPLRPIDQAPVPTFIPRDRSWLSFNERVLQEAEDSGRAPGERLQFAAIVSANLDEFYRVRIALHRAALRERDDPPRRALLDDLVRLTEAQQIRLGRAVREGILPALRKHGLYLLRPDELSGPEAAAFREIARDEVLPLLSPLRLRAGVDPPPFLENQRVYLAGALPASGELLLVPLPEGRPRFLTLRAPLEGRRPVLFLDDAVRMVLGDIFPAGESPPELWALKVSRDAELELDEEDGSDAIEALRRALARRPHGPPARVLVDESVPQAFLQTLLEAFHLDRDAVIPGGRYHNLSDLRGLPRPGHGVDSPPFIPIPHSFLSGPGPVTPSVAEEDRLLHFPYHSFDPVLRLLEEAGTDPDVTEIRATLYRVGEGSQVVDLLARAARAGKAVFVLIEPRARFDEDSNLDAGTLLESSGARVRWGIPGLKVHAKLLLIERRAGSAVPSVAYLATGNLNPKTARIYADHGLFTADPDVVYDVRRVFELLDEWEGGGGAARSSPVPDFRRILVAPSSLRSRLEAFIEDEVVAARSGRPARIVAKLNALEDPRMMYLLREAAVAGVQVRLIVRGISGLVPDSETGSRLEVRSLVDRFLEHARVYLFHAGGEERLYLSSADWMTRNLDRRVEVAFPIQAPGLRREILDMLELQLADGGSARLLDGELKNLREGTGDPAIRAQDAFAERIRRGPFATASTSP